MPLPLIGGILSYIQTHLGANVWDGEVPRQDTSGTDINPAASSIDWPVVQAKLDEAGLTTEWTFEDAYDDDGMLTVTVWGTSRLQEEALLFRIFALLAPETAWREINIGAGNFIYKLLLERWTSVQEEGMRTQLSEFLYRGELHYSVGAHGQTGTRPATQVIVTPPSTVTHSVAFVFTVTMEDPANNVETGYGGTVTFTSTDGSAVLPSPSTLSNGVGTFSATLVSVGGRTITATDNNTSGLTGPLIGVSHTVTVL